MKYLALILFVSCASMAKPVVQKEVIRPGDVRLLEFPVKAQDARLICRDVAIKFARNDDKARAIIVESYFSEKHPYRCTLTEDGKETRIFEFTVEEKTYKTEVLNVDQKRIKLSAKDQARADKEQKMLNKIYASSVPEFLFQKAFTPPLTSYITSIYGNRRLYNHHKQGQHLGTDFRAPIGEKVPAANRGKVVFSGDLFFTGGTVILDHGLDVFTVYGHLSKPLAKTGSIVERGEVIGLSGNSGRSSGPHLHWGEKIQGQYIDGFSLVEQTKKFYTE
jgi:murein DD-endopeptidase MepM/ murein hydrolase activator NlpD